MGVIENQLATAVVKLFECKYSEVPWRACWGAA
jgi:hypothetical protein